MVLTLARRGLVVGVILILLNGVSFVVQAEDRPESRRQEKWYLLWNLVDRGFVFSGAEAKFTSWGDCLAAQEKAVQRKMDELRPRGNDIAENDGTIVEKRRGDQWVLTVVHFFCTEEKG